MQKPLLHFFRGNKERLEKFGKSLALKSRQYRARRIAVNVKVNALSYVVEMLGGIIIAAFTFFRHAHILYTVGMIWYGNIIPLCYLINSTDTKKSILEEGWTSALSKICQKKEPKNSIEAKSRMTMEKRRETTRNTKNNESDANDKRENVSDESNTDENHTETETETVTMPDTTTVDEVSIAGYKKKCGEGKHNIKTTKTRQIDYEASKRNPIKKRNDILLYDLEHTNTACDTRYVEISPNDAPVKGLPYGLPHFSSPECSVYHISSNITNGKILL